MSRRRLVPVFYALTLCTLLHSDLQASALPNLPARPHSATLSGEQIGLSLEQAVALGLRNNRAIRSAHLQRTIEKFDLQVERDRFNPQLTLSSSLMSNRNRQDRSNQGRLTPGSTLLTAYGTRISLGWAYGYEQSQLGGRRANDGADFTIIQPLLRGAGREVTQAPLRIAQLAEQVNRLNLKSTLAETITRIILAYRELMRAQQRQQIVQAALQRTRQLLEVNRALISAGRMAAFDIVQTEAEEANQQLALEETRNTLHRARATLLQLLALDLHSPGIATDTPQAQHLELNARHALQQAQAMQPAWLVRLITIEQAKQRLMVARNAQLWDLSLVGGASQVREHVARSAGTRHWQHYAGLQLEIPISDQSQRQARIQAQVSLDTQALQLDEARQQLERDVHDGVREIDTRWRQLQIARRACELAERKMAIEQEKLRLGRSSNFQVLSFEADLQAAETTRLDALIGYLNAQTELDLTLGTTLHSWNVSLDE